MQAIESRGSEAVVRSQVKTQRAVKSVGVIRSEEIATRSRSENTPDTLLYLINYDGDMGFAVVAADNRLNQVYAISDQGNLEMSDTLTNKGLTYFWESVRADIESNMDAAGGPEGPIRPPVIRITRVHDQWVGAILKLRYGQDAPFNKYCKTSTGADAQVGCVAVACAQSMSYWEYPISDDGNSNFLWPGMHAVYAPGYGTSNAREQLARLMEALGRPANLDMDYGAGESSASSSAVPRTFQNFGYYNSAITALDAEMLRKYFYEHNTKPWAVGPVYASGSRTGGAHAWMIDGYIRYAKYGWNISKNDWVFVSFEGTLFHCNWGWEGRCNGFYYFGPGNPSFNLANGPKELHDTDPNPASSSNRNYDSQLKMVFRILPNSNNYWPW